MRKLALFAIIVALVIAAFVAWLLLPSFGVPQPRDLGASSDLMELAARLPRGSEVILLPRASVDVAALQRNPISRSLLESFGMPPQALWAMRILGDGALAIAPRKDSFSIATRTGPLRGWVASALMSTAGFPLRREGGLWITDSTAPPAENAESDRDAMSSATSGLVGHLFVVVFPSSHNDAPFAASALLLGSTVQAEGRWLTEPEGETNAPFRFDHPATAAVSIVSSRTPDLLRQAEPLIPEIRGKLDGGSLFAIWDVETGGALPRPVGALVWGSSSEPQLLGFGGGARRLENDPRIGPRLPSGEWSLQFDTTRTRRVIHPFVKSRLVRIVASRFHSRVERLDRWMGSLPPGSRGSVVAERQGRLEVWHLWVEAK
ncbi:MAG: hypothetical protein WBX15_07495 [Thermoanaerobaculia bacterium]